MVRLIEGGVIVFFGIGDFYKFPVLLFFIWDLKTLV